MIFRPQFRPDPKKKSQKVFGAVGIVLNITHPLVNIQKAIENGPFIVDLPIKNGGFPVRYVSLPEGTGCHPKPIDELHHFSRWLDNHSNSHR